MPPRDQPPAILFGYDSSPFTNKVRLALRVKQIPFSYIPVPSMLPRPLLTSTFALTYRKIPILAIGRDIYCDTSLIIEALEHFFPASAGWGSVYPKCEDMQGWSYRGLVRGFASFWMDKPLFRTTTGLIPSSVWSSSFGTDRAQLIGHKLSPAKLQAKIPQNLSNLDLHLSMLEPLFAPSSSPSSPSSARSVWLIPTPSPSLADISLYYQLCWGIDIAAGRGIYNLSGGGTSDTNTNITASVFNSDRFPEVWKWFHAFEAYIANLPDLESVVASADKRWKDVLRDSPFLPDKEMLVLTAANAHPTLDAQRGLRPGAPVSIAPDDTGRDNPTYGTLVKIGVEEVVIEPEGKGEIAVRIHFPRLGFIVKHIKQKSKL